MKFNLLIVNGWAATPQVFRPFIDLFKDQIEAFHILDWHDNSIINNEQISTGIKTLQDTKNSSHPTLLLGWSSGCFPILKYLASDVILSTVTGAVLIGASPRFTSDIKSGYSIGWHPKILNQMIENLHAQPRMVISSFTKKTISDNDGLAQELRAFYKKSFKLDTVEQLGNELKTLSHIDLRNQLHKISHPICLITGENDLICPLLGAKFINNTLDKSQLNIIKKAGHAPHVFEPEACIEIIKQFLKTNSKENYSDD